MTRSRVTGEPWRIGVLFSTTGSLAVIEDTQLRATLLAIREINAAGGILGRELVPIIQNPGSDPRAYGREAARLMTEEGVTAIFGCYTSSSRKAVLPVVERLDGLLFYPTLYEGFEFSANVIYTGAGPNQNCIALCNYMLAHHGPRFYFVGSDYCYPRATNRLMRDLVRGGRGAVVGQSYVGLQAGPAEFAAVIADIRDVQPDVVFSTVVGGSTAHLYRGLAEAGLDSRRLPIASLTTTEAELAAIGPEAGEGHITAASYFQSVGTARNAQFVDAYQRVYGREAHTNMCAEAAYFQVHMFAAALAACDTMSVERLRGRVLGATYDAPQGRVEINRACHHANVWSRIGRANRHGQFDVLAQSSGAVLADPYLVACGRSLEFA